MTHRYSQKTLRSPFRSFSHEKDSFANNKKGNLVRIDGIGTNEQTLLDVHNLTSVPKHEGVISAFRSFAQKMELKTVNGQLIYKILSFTFSEPFSADPFDLGQHYARKRRTKILFSHSRSNWSRAAIVGYLETCVLAKP